MGCGVTADELFERGRHPTLAEPHAPSGAPRGALGTVVRPMVVHGERATYGCAGGAAAIRPPCTPRDIRPSNARAPLLVVWAVSGRCGCVRDAANQCGDQNNA